jgi:hypothetical protein
LSAYVKPSLYEAVTESPEDSIRRFMGNSPPFHAQPLHKKKDRTEPDPQLCIPYYTGPRAIAWFHRSKAPARYTALLIRNTIWHVEPSLAGVRALLDTICEKEYSLVMRGDSAILAVPPDMVAIIKRCNGAIRKRLQRMLGNIPLSVTRLA